LGVLLRFDMVLPVGAARDGNSSARRPQGPCNKIFDTFTAVCPPDQSLSRRRGRAYRLCRSPAVANQSMLRRCQGTTGAVDPASTGFISYRRAGVAKRQARAAIRATRELFERVKSLLPEALAREHDPVVIPIRKQLAGAEKVGKRYGVGCRAVKESVPGGRRHVVWIDRDTAASERCDAVASTSGSCGRRSRHTVVRRLAFAASWLYSLQSAPAM
jgi:hypothetical protein